MTYTELVKELAQKLELKPNEVSILCQHAATIISQELEKKEEVRIKNFGSFVPVRHKSRTVPDPREMTKRLVIFDQYLPKFRPSEALRARIKNVNPLETEVEEGELAQSPAVPTQPAVPTVAPTPLVFPAQTIQQPAPSQPVPQPVVQQVSVQPTTVVPVIEQPAPTPTPAALPAPAAPTLPETPHTAANIGYIELDNLTINKQILDLIPYKIAQKYQMAPIKQEGDTLIMAMTDPGDREAIDLVERQTNLEVVPKLTTTTNIQQVLDQYGAMELELNKIATEEAPQQVEPEPETIETDDSAEGPTKKIVADIVDKAVRDKASDIHIEPTDRNVIVRFRVDGLLKPVLTLPKNVHASIVSRLKIMGNLKIDESRLPQDGRLRITVNRTPIDFRLSTLPTVDGEKIVMRILDKSAGIFHFDELGLDGENLRRLEAGISHSHGMTLVTGPTGSGKSTTLYAAITKLMNTTVNIVTLEDPVEYRITGINQSQVNAAIGYDFATGLRSIVRQDPDVILIGEIRDKETAEMAIHSALTGHIVLSTLHTNDAAGAIPRLVDMGIETFLITSSTNTIVAQRLARRICDHCKTPLTDIPPQTMATLQQQLGAQPTQQLTFYKGAGCDYCHGTGYNGRIGIYEVLTISETIKQLTLKKVSAHEIAEQAIKEGMVTLQQDGLRKAAAGITTLEEVWRVTKE